MTDSKLSALSKGQREALAKRHLSGETLTDLEGYAGLTRPQLKQLFKQQSMRDLMASQQGFYDQATARARLKLHMEVETAADVQIALMGSDSDEMKFKASRFILESVMPQRKIIEGEINVYHAADMQLIVELRDAMQDARTIPAKSNGGTSTFTPYMLTGTEGIEILEPSDSDPQAVGPGGPVGSGTTQEDNPSGEPEPPDAA